MKYALLVAAVLCSGCVAGILESKQPPQQTYVISAGQAQSAAGTMLAVNVAVARPSVGPGLFTDRIAAYYPDRRLDYFSGSRWGATSDIVVQSLLVQSLRNSGRLGTVQADISAFGAQYLLQSELRAFQAEYLTDSAAPVVRVSLVCTLGRIRGREPLAEYSADASVPAEENTMRAVVAAFESAYREAADSLVKQTMQLLEEQAGRERK